MKRGSVSFPTKLFESLTSHSSTLRMKALAYVMSSSPYAFIAKENKRVLPIKSSTDVTLPMLSRSTGRRAKSGLPKPHARAFSEDLPRSSGRKGTSRSSFHSACFATFGQRHAASRQLKTLNANQMPLSRKRIPVVYKANLTSPSSVQAATDTKISTPKLSRLVCAVSSGSLHNDRHDNRCSRRSRLDRHLAVELRREHLHQSRPPSRDCWPLCPTPLSATVSL